MMYYVLRNSKKEFVGGGDLEYVLEHLSDILKGYTTLDKNGTYTISISK